MFTLVTTSKFFFTGFATELHNRNLLSELFIGYPKFKLHSNLLPNSKLKSFPYIHAIHALLTKRSILDYSLQNLMEVIDSKTTSLNAKYKYNKHSDVVSISGTGVEINKIIKHNGRRHIVCRASRHILDQKNILLSESEKWDYRIRIPSSEVISRELYDYKNSDIIIVPSQICYDSFVNKGINMDKVKIINFPSSLSEYKSKYESSNEYKGKFRISFVGQVSLQKGIPTLLEAFSKINNAEMELCLVGPYEKKFLRHLYNLELVNDSVKFLGYKPPQEVKKIIEKSHLFVMPSVQEGWPMALNEAISIGCVPIISDAICNLNEIPFSDSRLRFQSGNVENLIEKITYFVNNPTELISLRKKLKTNETLSRTWVNFVNDFLGVLQ